MLNVPYQPRHLRLGVNHPEIQIEFTHEVKASVPVLGDDGLSDFTLGDVKVVPISETLGKYRAGDFKLKKLVDAGVPLKVFNLNRSVGAEISDLVNICQGIENSEAYVNRILQERQEKESWFTPLSSEPLINQNEVEQ